MVLPVKLNSLANAFAMNGVPLPIARSWMSSPSSSDFMEDSSAAAFRHSTLKRANEIIKRRERERERKRKERESERKREREREKEKGKEDKGGSRYTIQNVSLRRQGPAVL